MTTRVRKRLNGAVVVAPVAKKPARKKVRAKAKPAKVQTSGPVVPVGGALNMTGRSTLKSMMNPVNKRSKQLFAQYKDTYPAIAAQLILNGATEKDLIVAFKTKMPTFRLWQLTYPEFAAACVVARETGLAVRKVEDSLYSAARGYDIDEEKIRIINDKVVRIKTTKHIPIDVNAGKFLLANWAKDRYGKDPDGASTNPDGAGSGNTNINIGGITIGMLKEIDTESLKKLQGVVTGMAPVQRPLTRLDTVNADDAETVPVKEDKDAKKKD